MRIRPGGLSRAALHGRLTLLNTRGDHSPGLAGRPSTMSVPRRSWLVVERALTDPGDHGGDIRAGQRSLVKRHLGDAGSDARQDLREMARRWLTRHHEPPPVAAGGGMLPDQGVVPPGRMAYFSGASGHDGQYVTGKSDRGYVRGAQRVRPTAVEADGSANALKTSTRRVGQGNYNAGAVLDAAVTRTGATRARAAPGRQDKRASERANRQRHP